MECSEKQIQAIVPRAGSPDWLVTETGEIKRGLMALRQNVVLLRDERCQSSFYPVGPALPLRLLQQAELRLSLSRVFSHLALKLGHMTI